MKNPNSKRVNIIVRVTPDFRKKAIEIFRGRGLILSAWVRCKIDEEINK